MAGILLTIFTLVKYWIESAGVIRANTFGWIQITMLITGIITMAAGFAFARQAHRDNFRSVGYFLSVVFLILMVLTIPGLWQAAEAGNAKYNNTVPTVGDDVEYQILAVNMLYGVGFSPAVVLPLEYYKLNLKTAWGPTLKQLYEDNSQELLYENDYFYRPPGLPVMLWAAYALFGNEPLVARQMMVVLSFLTAVLLLLLGMVMAGWVGVLAGGFAGLYHLYFYPGLYDFERILTEAPAAFWITLLCLLVVLYIKKRRRYMLLLVGLNYAILCLVHPNLMFAIVFFIAYLLYRRVDRRSLIYFTAAAVVPLALYSAYASISMGSLVTITTQGNRIFWEYNNILVLEGIGPDHSGQGAGHKRGEYTDQDGSVVTFDYDVDTGESGYQMGLKFWFDNFEELPRLFYVKLKRGFFYDNRWSVNIIHPEGIHLVGLGFLLMALGFRPPREDPCPLERLSSKGAVILQLALIGSLMVTWNQLAFWLVCLTWFAIGFIALVRPYGDIYELPFEIPTWYFPLVISHGITTIMYGGYRHHWPLDVQVNYFALLGISLVLFELFKRKTWPALPFLAVILFALGRHFVYLW